MKAIKFNLQYGDKQIKSLAELKEYGNIDMLLETLNNGMLERWLAAQGYKELVEKIQPIDKSNCKKACDALCKVFFDADANVAQKATAELFKIRKEEEKRLESLKGLKEQEKEIINNYHDGYNNIILSFKKNANDYAVLKAGMVELNEKYRDLLVLDKENFYSNFKNHSLVLLAFMANKQLRDYIDYNGMNVYQDIMNSFRLNENNNKIIKPNQPIVQPILDSKITTDVNLIVTAAFRWNYSYETTLKDIELVLPKGWRAIFINNRDQLDAFKNTYGNITTYHYYHDYRGTQFEEIQVNYASTNGYYIVLNEPSSNEKLNTHAIPNYIKVFYGPTYDEYWADIEPEEKTFMIISIEKGNVLRSIGEKGEKFKDDDINGKFIFTQGIEYMSKSNDPLIYMEI